MDWNKILSNIGYAVKAPGLGISQPVGTPYSAGRTPDAVYSARAAGTDPIQPNQAQTNQNTYNALKNYTKNTGNTINYGTNAAGGYGVNDWKSPTVTTQSSGGAPSGLNPADLNKWAIEHGYTGINDYNDKQKENSSTGIDYSALDREAENLYNSGMDTYNKQEGYLTDQWNTSNTNTESDVENSKTKALAEQEQLLGGIQENKDKYLKVISSALSEAQRAYNALAQQGKSRFGMGNSAGGAISELAQQEYLRNQGNINSKAVEGEQAFASEVNKAKLFITGKLSDLDQYKKEALAALKTNYQNAMNQVGLAKGELTANKSRDKMALMQQTIQYAQQIAETDRATRAAIAQSTINGMQETMGRAFTPAEIKAVLAEFGINMGNLGGNTVAAATKRYKNALGQTVDEYGNIIS